MLLGTGGGSGGFDAGVWLANGGGGFDTAQTYCYFTSPRRNGLPASACSQVAIANAVSILSIDVKTQFIISKIEPEDFGVLDVFSGFGRVFDRGILQEMSVAALDMLMFHQAGRGESATNVRPSCFNASAGDEGKYAACRVETFAAMQQLVQSGAARSIGVSNFQVRDLMQLFEATGSWPSALELEVHPWWHEDELIDFCIAKGIVIINYAPVALAQPAYLGNPVLAGIANAHGISPAQALLLWGLQRTQGVVIPRSANARHMLDNQAVFALPPLTDAEMAALAGMPQKKIFNVYCQPWC
jgi:diketogulonate reductase-like aldo/keto reductase